MSLADVIAPPVRRPPQLGALWVDNGRLYVEGQPGYLCIGGSPHSHDYAQWVEQLGPNAVTIREGL